MTVAPPRFSIRTAEAFVLGQGTPRQKAFWKAAFGCGPVEVLIFELEPFLDEQGRWSGLATSELAAAVQALQLLGAVNLGEDIFEVGARTVTRLLARRAPDGSWDEAGPWPGEAAGDDAFARRAWYVAMLGAYLPRLTGSADDARVASLGVSAARWLLARRDVLATAGPAAWTATLASAGAAAEASGSAELAGLADEVAAMLLAWLDEPRRPLDLAHVHEACVLAGRATDDPLRQRAWQALAAGQEPDGGWGAGSDAGWAGDRVDATIAATRAVVRP